MEMEWKWSGWSWLYVIANTFEYLNIQMGSLWLIIFHIMKY